MLSTVNSPKKPSIGITSNRDIDISDWDTNVDIVFVTDEDTLKKPHSIMLDAAGRVTTDSSKAKSVLYQEVKDGKIVTRQEPVFDIDKEIAELWKLAKEIDEEIRANELTRQLVNSLFGRK